MPRLTPQRRRAISRKMSHLGKLSQAAQHARRMAAMDPEMRADIAANPPLVDGSPLGCFSWQNFRSGQVSRWTVLRGNRSNNFRLRTPDLRTSKAHGLAWIFTRLRTVILHKI